MMLETKHTPLANTPKAWMATPIFGMTSKSPGVLVYKGKEEWQTGLEKEMDGRPAFVKGLTIEHGIVLLGMMSFQPMFEEPETWHFSLKKLSHIVYGNYGSKQYQRLRSILTDLCHCRFRVKDIDTGVGREMSVLTRVDILKKPSRIGNDDQMELWLDCVEIHPTYYEMMKTLTTVQMVDVEIFKQVKGNLAKSIYMILPSRAFFHTEGSPFEITFDKVLEQVRAPDSQRKSKSLRKRALDRKSSSIIERLDGVKILGGHTMRVTYRMASDESDYVLQAWVEKAPGYLPSPPGTIPGNLTERFFKERCNYTPKNWAQLVEKANKVDWPRHIIDRMRKWIVLGDPTDWRDKARQLGNDDWQFRIYFAALGEFAFNEIISAESDGKAGIGALINKFRHKLERPQALKALPSGQL